MKLQILVPQYQETDKIIKPLLDSIALQQNIDFINDLSVIICNDGSDIHLSDPFLQSYPFKIKYYLNDHKGVSATRQFCLDHATADYVMFCDADDMFYNLCGLWTIFEEIDKEEFDILYSCFIEENRFPDNTPTYLVRDQDSTFIHGKIYRRLFLKENNIEWDFNLLVHEDSYFNGLCQCFLDSENRGKYCNTPFYLWKWRDQSISRQDPNYYILTTYPDMLKSMTALLNKLLQCDQKSSAEFYCANLIFDIYYRLNTPLWQSLDNQVYKENTEQKFAKFYKKFENLFLETSDEIKQNLSYQIRNKMVAEEGLITESITFTDWINKIQSL